MDWIQFLDSNQVYYRTSGPNTSRGQLVTHCCWCGIDDPSEHLSINLAGKGFRCWRNPQHSGKNPAKLIQALLKCSWEEANRLAGQEKRLPSDFLGKIKAVFVKPEKAEHKQKLILPPEFKELKYVPSAKPYIAYLKGRGFSAADILNAKTYGIYYASLGNYKGRIIFTVENDGKLVGWTGRTIYETAQVRYKTLTHDIHKASERGEIPAPSPISAYLGFYDRATQSRAKTIVLVEGPFDAWRANVLGEQVGVVATCFFTSTLSKEQMNLLHELLPRFKRRVLLLDEGTFTKAAKIRSDLAALDVESIRLVGFKDPAMIQTSEQLKIILR